MTFRERVLAGIIASGLAIAVLGPCEPTRSSTVITEDSPGWDCRTMGNKICGPEVSVTSMVVMDSNGR